MASDKRRRATAILLLLGSLLLMCYGCRAYRAKHLQRAYGLPIPEEETLLYRRCREDKACVYVANGCCPCGSSMEELSINKALKPAFERRMSQECAKGRVCPDGMRFPDCGTGRNICKDGICTFVAFGWDGAKQEGTRLISDNLPTR